MKLKTCDGCQKETVIWKNHEGFKYCKYCWSCHKSGEDTQKPTSSEIPRVSAKRAKKDAEYAKLRQRYLTENPLCMIKGPNCTHYATDVHHSFAGGNRDAFYLVQSTWFAVCRADHNMIHENPADARTMGWLK